MAGLCLLTAAGALATTVAAQSFTLAWIHSVEKIEWQEDWRVADGRLVPAGARVKGSGAGMEPPPGAVLRDGWWHYRPDLPPQERVVLARSAFVDDYRLCWDGACRPMAALVPLESAGGATVLTACDTELE